MKAHESQHCFFANQSSWSYVGLQVPSSQVSQRRGHPHDHVQNLQGQSTLPLPFPLWD